MNPTEMFLKKKKDDSAFITLQDGESIDILSLREIKCIVKAGFKGEDKDVLRLICDVKTDSGIKTKNFDNGSAKFATELTVKKVDIGSSFTITRTGEQTKTVYTISNVKNQVSTPAQPAQPAQPATPAPTADGAPAGIINN